MVSKRSIRSLAALVVVLPLGCSKQHGANNQKSGTVTSVSRALDSSWTPHAFDSWMEAWYTASTGVSADSTGMVSGWADQSVHHRNLSQTVPGGGPKLNTNGQGVPTLTFNGGQLLRNDAWSTTPAGTESEITILAVVRSAAPQDWAVAGFWDPNGQGYFWAGLRKSGQLSLLETWRVYSNSPGQEYVGAQDLGTAVPHVVAWRYQPATGVLTQVIDGVSSSSASMPAIGPLPAMPFIVGAKSLLPTGLFQGDVSELLVLSHALADGDIQSYTAYARNTWNLTAPPLTGGPCLDASNAPTPPTTRCDDGNPQTYGDHCSQGTCVGTVPPSGNPGALTPVAWYHANPQEVVAADADQNVSIWFDRSPNHLDLLQPFYYGRPKLGSNWPGGKPAIHFNGGTGLRRDNWSSAPAGASQAFTVLAVIQAGSTTQNGAVAAWWNSTGYDQVSCSVKASGGDVAPDLLRADNSGTRQEFTDQVRLGTSPHAIVWRYTPDTVTVTVDGQSVPSNRFAPIGPIGPQTFLVGMQNSLPTGLFVGDIAELAVVPRSITDSEVAAFDSYAAAEWGGCVGVPDGTSCGAAGSGAVCQVGVCVTPSCSTAADGSQTFSATADFGAGPVTMTMTQAPDGASPLTTITYTRNGQTLETEQIAGPDAAGLTHLVVGYGVGFHGIGELDVSSDGSNLTETVDGRQLQPFPAADAQPQSTNPPPLTFVDGGPAPTVTVDDGVLQAIAAISSRAGVAANLCGMSQTAQSAPLLEALSPPTVPGHTDNPPAFPACRDCRVTCTQNLNTCELIAESSCVGLGSGLAVINPFVGLGAWAACEAAAEGGCLAMDKGCVNMCGYLGGPCCPQACGVSCCDRTETCLNTGSGLCCDAGYTACAGPLQSCVDLTRAVCLPSGQGCGRDVPTCGSGAQQTCCPSGLCNGNQCVPSSNFFMSAAATVTTEGPITCIHGAGFTPGATVTFTYSGIPKRGTVAGGASALVDASGKFALTDFSQERMSTGCTNDQLSATVTLTATDGSPATVGTGAPVTATLPASAWCANDNGPTLINGGCN